MRTALCFLMLFGWPLTAFSASISYDELPRLIQEKNENLKAARTHAEAQEKRTGHLARSFLPEVTAHVGEEEFKTGSETSRRQGYWRLGATLNVYRGGRDRLDEDARESQATAAKADSAREYHQELRRARIAFWEIVALEKLIGFRKEEYQKNEENVRSAKKRAGAGVATNADAVQFEVHRSNLEQEIKQLELRKDFSRNRLSVALGLDEHENLVVRNDFPKLSNEEVSTLTVQNQLEVKSLKAKERAEDLKAQQAGRWWLPKLDVYANYGLPALSDELDRAVRKDTEMAAGVRLSLDFGQGLNEASEARARSLEAKSIGLRAAYKTRETIATDHELRHDIRLTTELIQQTEKNIVRAREFLNLTQKEYARGVKNGPDLLGAFRQFYELQEKAVGLQRDLMTAKAELEGLVATEATP